MTVLLCVPCSGGATGTGARGGKAGRREAPVPHDHAKGKVREVAVPRTGGLVGVDGETYCTSYSTSINTLLQCTSTSDIA